VTNILQYFLGRRKKNKIEIDHQKFDALSKAEKIATTKEARTDFLQKLEMYKFFVAGNFYLDNLGKVEIV